MSRVSRITLSLHVLLHLFDNIKWHGNPIHYSQFPTERKIGRLKQYVKQFKQFVLCFRNLVLQVSLPEQLAMVKCLYPEIVVTLPRGPSKPAGHLGGDLTRAAVKGDLEVELSLVRRWLRVAGVDGDQQELSLKQLCRWTHSGLLTLPGGDTLRSLCNKEAGNERRCACRFRAQNAESGGEFCGEVVHYLQVPHAIASTLLSFPSIPSLAFVRRYRPGGSFFDSSKYTKLRSIGRYVSREFDSEIIPTDWITEKIGVVDSVVLDKMFILRKIPAVEEQEKYEVSLSENAMPEF